MPQGELSARTLLVGVQFPNLCGGHVEKTLRITRRRFVPCNRAEEAGRALGFSTPPRRRESCRFPSVGEPRVLVRNACNWLVD